MKTSFVRLLALLVPLFFLASPVPLPAQEHHGPDRFDISGFKLGGHHGHGGPGLKADVEALPEGYKCLDIEEDGKLMGYSCFAPVAPEDPFAPKARIASEATKHLFFMFDDNGKVRFIHERGKPEKALLKEQYEALVEKYGEPSNSRPDGAPPQTMNNIWGPVWAFDKSGEKIDGFEYKDLGLGKTEFSSISLFNSNFTGLDMPVKFSENQGVVFSAFLVPAPGGGEGEPTVLGYALSLFESQ